MVSGEFSRHSPFVVHDLVLSMPERKSFLLRLPPELLDELNRWARDELRSLNGQIEFLLRDALRRGGRRSPADPEPASSGEIAGSASPGEPTAGPPAPKDHRQSPPPA